MPSEGLSIGDRPTHGGNLNWAAGLAACSPHEILDFSASINPLGPPASVRSALAENLGKIIHYPTPGYAQLCRVLAQHHNVSPDYILPGNGAAELLTWAGRSLGQLQAAYLFTPAFADYGRSLRAFNASIVPCPLVMAAVLAGEPDWVNVLNRHLDVDPKHCGLLLNTPHNPTGLLIPPDILQDWLQQFALVVVDEAFMDFLPPAAQTSVVNQVARYPNLVVLRSLTKFYSLPGLRLGYAVMHPDRVRLWQTWQDPWPVNVLAEVAAIVALEDTAYQRATWQWLSECKAGVEQQLRSLPGLSPVPGQANYLLIRTEYPGPKLQLDLLQHHRILVRDCLSFDALGTAYIRIAIRTAAENQRLINALADVL